MRKVILVVALAILTPVGLDSGDAITVKLTVRHVLFADTKNHFQLVVGRTLDDGSQVVTPMTAAQLGVVASGLELHAEDILDCSIIKEEISCQVK